MKRARSFLWGVVLWALVVVGAGWTLLTTQWFSQQFPTSTAVNLDSKIEQLRDWINQLGWTGDMHGSEKYNTVFQLLQTQYYHKEKLDQDKMQENALKWFVDALGDPYTVYLTPSENTKFDEEMQGSKNFEGIGAVVTKKEDGVLVEEVLKGHPAYIAGIKPLDVILEVDGESIQSLWLNEAVDKIRGPKWTEVTLTVYRESAAKIIKIVVTRDAISVPSAKGEILELDGHKVLYVEILTFGDDTRKVFADILAQYQATKFDGVVVDLRGNGGGYLPIAVDISSFFIPKGEVITTAKYSTFPEESYKSAGYGNLEGIPLIVLVDWLSASASEIMAAALQQDAHGKLVGEKTFGKWSIQTLHEIDDGSSLKYTIGARYTPAGTNVDKVGLPPDVEVTFDTEAYLSGGVDNQLESAKVEVEKLIEGK